jgi:hypothetical protein
MVEHQTAIVDQNPLQVNVGPNYNKSIQLDTETLIQRNIYSETSK